MGKSFKAIKKPAMMYGGMANNKKHMYAAGGSVKDNPGLKALAKQRPDVVAKMMKGWFYKQCRRRYSLWF